MENNIVTLTKHSNGIAELTINRSEKHNSFDHPLIRELTLKLQDIEMDTDVRVLVLSAKGQSFSAGADLTWMKDIAGYTMYENIADASDLAELMATLNRLPKPTIAKVQGPAYGGGTGLIACCDIAIASDNSHFCFTEVKLGLIPAIISPYIIAAIGKRQAKRYMLTAETISAEKALEIGLLHEVTTPEKLHEDCMDLANRLLLNGPMAMSATKKLIGRVAYQPINEELIQETTERIAEIRVSPEGQKGIAAFLDKRTPDWNEK